ncbi:MAG: hypothetical protein WBN75_08455 [Verrucomicrobiia bacterium]
MNTRKLQLAIVAAGLAGALSASAVTLTFGGVSPEEDVTIQIAGAITYSGTVQAGIYNQTVDGVATPSLCIDVYREISGGETFTDYSYTDLSLAPLPPSGPMGSAVATDIEKLWAAHFPAASVNNQDAAALTVAVWEDIAANVGTYTITASGNDPVTTEAANMLASLGSLTAQADLVGLASPDGQNYVVAAPEPTTAGCFLLGLGALACSRRWRQRKCV